MQAGGSEGQPRATGSEAIPSQLKLVECPLLARNPDLRTQ